MSGVASAATPTDSRQQQLRQLGALAHQVRAAMRAADHFVTQGAEADRDTGPWLVSCAATLSADLAGELDSMARAMKDLGADATLSAQTQRLRVRAHQMHAASRAADHYLEQDSHEDRETGSWLIACALGLANRMAGEMDDSIGGFKRAGGVDAGGHGAAPMQASRPAFQDVATLRGAA